MVRPESIPEASPATVAVDLSSRRARLRRRRRRDAYREWAGLAAVVTVSTWLAAIAVMSLVAH